MISFKEADFQLHQGQQWRMFLAVTGLTICYSPFLPLWLTVFLVANSWLLRRYRFRAGTQSAKVLLVAAVVLGSAGVFVHYQSFTGRDAGVSLLMLMCGLKAWEVKRRRDAVLVIYLCFFLTAGLFLFEQNLLMAAAALACVVSITQAWLALDSPDPSMPGTLNAVYPSLFPWRTGAAIFLAALPGALILFVLFPRLNYPLWHAPLDESQARTGLGEQMVPGSIAKLTESNDIAFRVKFLGPAPAKQLLYWRALVFWQTDGRRWLPTPQPRLYSTTHVHPKGVAVRYRVILEPHGKPWLFSLDVPLQIPVEGGLYRDFQLKAHDPVTQRLRYEVTSVPRYRLDAQAPERRMGLQLPPGQNPRTLNWAASLRRESTSDGAFVERVLHYFKSQGFRYSLHPTVLGSAPVDEFLFETQSGFCGHFATAFVYVMRAAGIPARIISGYQGGEYNPAGDYYIVRQKDAHAWTEVYLAGEGWQRFDPTALIAPHRLSAGIDEFRSHSATSPTFWIERYWRPVWFYLDSINTSFQNTVAAYNGTRQKRFFYNLGWGQISQRQMLIYAMLLSSGIVLLVGARLLISRPPPNPAEVALFLKLCQMYAKRGFSKPPSRSSCAHLNLLIQHHPKQARILAAFSRSYEHYRFSAVKDKKDLLNMRRLLRTLRV